MKASEAKKFVGKIVKWVEPRSYIQTNRTGLVLEVRGKNILISDGGMTDWRWLPDMRGMEEVHQPEAAQ